jgi:hypothetical protein
LVVFSTLAAAYREGFLWCEFLPDQNLHRVERDIKRADGRRMKMVAFARPEEHPSDN